MNYCSIHKLFQIIFIDRYRKWWDSRKIWKIFSGIR